jgi:hypothetical protein
VCSACGKLNENCVCVISKLLSACSQSTNCCCHPFLYVRVCTLATVQLGIALLISIVCLYYMYAYSLQQLAVNELLVLVPRQLAADPLEPTTVHIHEHTVLLQ